MADPTILSAAGQTAAQAVDNVIPSRQPGAGVVSAAADTTLSAKELTALTQNSTLAEGQVQTFQVPTPVITVTERDEAGNAVKVEINDGTVYDNAAQKELSVKPVVTPTNRLHEYTDYTYRATLFLLTKEDHEKLSANPTSFNPKHALISSGGTFNQTSGLSVTVSLPGESSTVYDILRHPDFEEDFFIENIQIQTVVGLNARTKASNAIDISFDIIEPYGMTLLDRLLSACETTAKCPNYIEQPYLLQIDFLANVDEAKSVNGLPNIVIDQKRLAIRLIEVKIKPGPGGTEYKVRAIPYNHWAFSQTNSTLPINLAVEAATIGDFFDSKDNARKAIGDSIKANQERIESELQKWKDTFFEVVPTQAEIAAKRAELNLKVTYASTSFPAGFNEYTKSVSELGKLSNFPQTLISFQIDPLFESSPLVDGDVAVVNRDPLVDPENAGIGATTSSYVNPEYKTKQIYNIHAGTDVMTVIDRIMQASAYIKNQVLQAKQGIEEAAQQERETGTPSAKKMEDYKFIDWYKIVPQVKLLEFDAARNAYSKQIIFSVVPYKTANPYHPDFAKTKINKKKVVRSYQYLYTGKNEDVIAVDIDFNLAFYAQLTSYQDRKRRSGNNLTSNDPNVNNLQTRDNSTDRRQDIQLQYNVVGSEQRGTTGFDSGRSDKSQAVASMAKSLYTSSRGDMLNIRIRIVGDPAFIKQDDVYYNPASEDYKLFIGTVNPDGPPITLTGQILYDVEQVYVQFITKSAVDIDDLTGITNKQITLSNGRQTDATFSGAYKVLTVKSDFVRGKFEQTLDLVRMPNEFEESDTAATDASVMVVGSNPTAAAGSTETPTPPPPLADVTDTPQVLAALKEAGRSAAVNPVAAIPGAGTLGSTNFSALAAPLNINDTRFLG